MIESARRRDPDDFGEPRGAERIERPLSRRTVLRSLVGVAGLAAFPNLLAACAGTTSATHTTAARSPEPSVPPPTPSPSATPAAGLTVATIFPETDEVISRFTAQTGIQVNLRTIDAGSFSDEMQPYLEAAPEDVISWGKGRNSMLTIDGLLRPLDDVWTAVGSNFPASVRDFVTMPDHHSYQMPVQVYAWAVFYRKSLFADRGYTVPTSWPAFVALAARMQRDGLIPIAMGDAELFEAMGMFDILDLRLNGCQFHLDLLAGKEKWTDPRVKRVFDRWLEIIPYTQVGAVGRDEESAAQSLFDRKAGMHLMGTGILVPSIPAADLDDVDIFPFPALGTPWDDEQSFDMPVDGFAITRKSRTLPADLDNAEAFIAFLSKGPTQQIFSTSTTGNVAVALDADTTSYNHIQRKVVEMIGSAKRVAEYFDRDSDYGFANKVETAVQGFLSHPATDVDGLLRQFQGFADHP